MAKVSQPELKRFLDKRVSVNIQGGRRVQGTLRGFDMFLNLVVDEAQEMIRPAGGGGGAGPIGGVWSEGPRCGTVVSLSSALEDVVISWASRSSKLHTSCPFDKKGRERKQCDIARRTGEYQHENRLIRRKQLARGLYLNIRKIREDHFHLSLCNCTISQIHCDYSHEETGAWLLSAFSSSSSSGNASPAPCNVP